MCTKYRYESPLYLHLSVHLTFHVHEIHHESSPYRFNGGEILFRSIDYQSRLSERINFQVNANKRRCGVALCSHSRFTTLTSAGISEIPYAVIT